MAEQDVPPNPFPDPSAEDVAVSVQPLIPGSTGGPIEAMKRAVMQSMRAALTGTSMTLNSTEIKVSMDYPMTKVLNPGIWVQFSYTDLNRAGIDHEVYHEIDGEIVPVQEWIYYGLITLTVVAYTSLERDRISDGLINEIAFARTPDLVLTKGNEDTKQFRSLINTINQNPYVNLTINTDSLTPGGQGMSIGTPWDELQEVYEDTYSFELIGQFNVAFRHEGSYTLTAINIDPEPELVSDDPAWSPWV